MEWMYELGGSVAATLPLLGAFLDEPFDPSPYSPASRLFWNEFYTDVGGKRSDSPSPRTGLIDYRKAMADKRRIIEKQARQRAS